MYIGIDPGYQGSFVHIDKDKSFISSHEMPVMKLSGPKVIAPSRVQHILSECVKWGAKVAFIEEIWTGRELMKGLGVVEACAVEVGLSVCYVKPKAWQMYCFNKLNRGNKKLSYSWCSKRYEQQVLQKENKVWYDVCDALCIANCGLGAYSAKGGDYFEGLITRKNLGY